MSILFKSPWQTPIVVCFLSAPVSHPVHLTNRLPWSDCLLRPSVSRNVRQTCPRHGSSSTARTIRIYRTDGASSLAHFIARYVAHFGVGDWPNLIDEDHWKFYVCAALSCHCLLRIRFPPSSCESSASD